MKKIHHFATINPAFFFGFGYMEQTYTEGPVTGWCKYVFIPFFCIKIAWLEYEE